MLPAIQHSHSSALSPSRYGRKVAALAARATLADATVPEHAASVAALAVRIGEELGLGRRELELLELAAAVHDVGKLDVSPAILAKPGSLDPTEWAAVRRHPAAGAQLLEDCSAPPAVVAVVRGHHERWDGAGYPDGLSGDAIPLGARIVAIADAYCAMLEERPYREPRTAEEARAELAAQAGRQFDPLCAEATCRIVATA